MMINKMMKAIKTGIWCKELGLVWENEWNRSKRQARKHFQYPFYSFTTCNKSSLNIKREDIIQPQQNLLLRKYTLQNDTKKKQKITLLFQQDFDYLDGIAFFNINNKAVYHEYEGIYVLCNGSIDDKGIFQYAIWQEKDMYNRNIINEKNGSLFLNPISAGSVKSTFSLQTELLPFEWKHAYYWMIIGETIREINRSNALINTNPEQIVKEYVENDISDSQVFPLSK